MPNHQGRRRTTALFPHARGRRAFDGAADAFGYFSPFALTFLMAVAYYMRIPETSRC